MEKETRLAFFMRKLSLTDDEICEKTGVTKANLSKFKAGSAVPNVTLGIKIAKFLGVKVEDIWAE